VTSADPAGGALTLRRKLEVEGESRLLHTVRGVGFVLREDPL
jgi:two-component system response regulator MprA